MLDRHVNPNGTFELDRTTCWTLTPGLRRDRCQTGEKSAEETDCIELGGETGAVMLGATSVDELSVAVVEVGVAGELFRGGRFGEVAVAAGLLIREGLDGHRFPERRGRGPPR
jgi:hypothetical protein